MTARWQSFENQVRDIASRLYGLPCQPDHIAGNDIDGVIKRSSDQILLFEITVEFDLEKVRADINKLVLTRNHLFGLGILSQGWVVLERRPTKAMTEGGEANHIRVISVGTLLTSFIDYSRYKNTRIENAFGSAVDPLTGVADKIQYVPVKYIERSTQHECDASDLANTLLAGDNIVLLGEYGSGKESLY